MARRSCGIADSPPDPSASSLISLHVDGAKITATIRRRHGDRIEGVGGNACSSEGVHGGVARYEFSGEMKRKIKRLTHQAGYGVETMFNADICQGNFNHHGLQTKEAYRQRLANLGL